VLAKNAPSADEGGLAAEVREQLQPSRSARSSPNFGAPKPTGSTRGRLGAGPWWAGGSNEGIRRSGCISGEAITLPRTGRASCFRIRVARRSSADRKLLAAGLAQTPTDIATRLSLSTA
jgi:hypothetical protein